MLQTFFLWFYCLPISYSILLVIMISIVYHTLRQRWGKTRPWRTMVTVIFLIDLAVIASATLLHRTSGIFPATPKLIPFHSYRAVISGENKEILRSNLMNMILFYPAGLSACELLPKRWRRTTQVVFTTVLFAIVSAGIEFCQYRFVLGQAEADDVIHNTLGTFIGALVCTIHIKQKPNKSKD